jgi:hypothetical protein
VRVELVALRMAGERASTELMRRVNTLLYIIVSVFECHNIVIWIILNCYKTGFTLFWQYSLQGFIVYIEC